MRKSISIPPTPFDKGEIELFVKNITDDAIHSKRGIVRYFKELKEKARQNRNNPTPSENKIWNEILKNRKTGFTFLRQKPLYRFIADFYCSELSLVIEIDGSSHDLKKGTDDLRDRFFDCIGIKTLRFTNDDVLNNIDYVKQQLKISLVKGRNPEGERD